MNNFGSTLFGLSKTINPVYIPASEYKNELYSALDNRNTFFEFKAKMTIVRDKQLMHNSIKKVIFNNPATIVIWVDGSKTVVKCDDEEFDPEKGLAMAIAKKLLGNNQGYYYEIFKKWLPKEEEKKPAIHIAKLLRSKGVRPDGKEVKHLMTRGEVKAAHKY